MSSHVIKQTSCKHFELRSYYRTSPSGQGNKGNTWSFIGKRKWPQFKTFLIYKIIMEQFLIVQDTKYEHKIGHLLFRQHIRALKRMFLFLKTPHKKFETNICYLRHHTRALKQIYVILDTTLVFWNKYLLFETPNKSFETNIRYLRHHIRALKQICISWDTTQELWNKYVLFKTPHKGFETNICYLRHHTSVLKQICVIWDTTTELWNKYLLFETPHSRLPNARMLNIWLNIKNNCSMKKIQNWVMSCKSLWIPAFVV